MIHLLTFLQFLGVVMVCSIATISVHFLLLYTTTVSNNAPLHD